MGPGLAVPQELLPVASVDLLHSHSVPARHDEGKGRPKLTRSSASDDNAFHSLRASRTSPSSRTIGLGEAVMLKAPIR